MGAGPKVAARFDPDGQQFLQFARLTIQPGARYGLRPALSLERVTEAADRTLRYQMKRRFADLRPDM